jgi:hypothetical protein
MLNDPCPCDTCNRANICRITGYECGKFTKYVEEGYQTAPKERTIERVFKVVEAAAMTAAEIGAHIGCSKDLALTYAIQLHKQGRIMRLRIGKGQRSPYYYSADAKKLIAKRT